MRPAASKIIRFGRFELDLIAGELHAERQRIPLQEQPFQLLRMLVDRPGELLTREDIRRRLWPNGTMVEFDDSINTAIKKLRLALGDSAEEPRYVETVARRGYRLMVPVYREERADTALLSEAPRRQECDRSTGNQIGTEASRDRVLEILLAAATVDRVGCRGTAGGEPGFGFDCALSRETSVGGASAPAGSDARRSTSHSVARWSETSLHHCRPALDSFPGVWRIARFNGRLGLPSGPPTAAS